MGRVVLMFSRFLRIDLLQFPLHEILILRWHRRGTTERKGRSVQSASSLALFISLEPRGCPWALPVLHENKNESIS